MKKVIVNSVPSRAESRSAGYSGVFARPQPKMESSDRYTPQDSLALARLLYDIRMSWGMRFAGEV